MANENLSEKVSVNMNVSTLSNIDLLVDNGYYSNRSDFINQAVRERLQSHQRTIDRIIDREIKDEGKPISSWFVGVYDIRREFVEESKAKGKTASVTGYGVLIVNDDVDEEMLYEVVTSIKIKGKIICRPSIKQHYGLK
ncbi:MAG: hypothetical protein IJP11_03030 [Oscillospiraceae bacterium]|nr:hypothetical protein [Oscillospiraceae bacterium]